MKAFILVDYDYGESPPRNVMAVIADSEAEAIDKLEALHPGRYTDVYRGKRSLDRSHGFDELDICQ